MVELSQKIEQTMKWNAEVKYAIIDKSGIKIRQYEDVKYELYL